MIAANIGARQFLDAIVDLFLATYKRILQADLVCLRLKTRDVFFLIGHQFFGIPGAETACKFIAECADRTAKCCAANGAQNLLAVSAPGIPKSWCPIRKNTSRVFRRRHTRSA